jgi:hypothetical protein
MNQEPDAINDMNPLAQAAIATHEMYRQYVAAGFTPDEALRLIAYMLKTNQQPGDETR